MKWLPTTFAAYIFATVLIQVSFPRAQRGTIYLTRKKHDFRGEYGKRLDSILTSYNHRLDSLVETQKQFEYEE
jgi:hypothetical protein